MPRILAILLLSCTALSCSGIAQAWGPLGHRLVARLAEPRLTPQARAEIDRLLATEQTSSLADIANWADDLRANDPGLGRRSAKWHFINIGEHDCAYDAAHACPNGDCVVEAIRIQADILADRTRPDAERLQALKFVVHFVGDVHQPLHAGYARDRGGNTVQVNLHGKGTNLHSLWDSRLLASARLGEDAYEARLRLDPDPLPAGTDPYTPSAPAVWAEQSCRIALAPGVYPPRSRIDDDYLLQHRPTVERQVQLAGARLAQVLNTALMPLDTGIGTSREKSTPLPLS